jgi:hypothetical protein
VVEEAFDAMGLSAVRLEVFRHNARAIAAYTRVGFVVTGEHTEWVARKKTELRVMEMRLTQEAYKAADGAEERRPSAARASSRDERRQRRSEREARRDSKRQKRTDLDGEANEDGREARPTSD